jgi:hypothetical protein
LDTGKPGRRFLRFTHSAFWKIHNLNEPLPYYDRGNDYAIRATIIRTGRERLQDLSLDEWSHALNEVQASHQPALYWMGQCWGSWLMQNLDSVDAFTDISRLEKLMNKVLENNNVKWVSLPGEKEKLRFQEAGARARKKLAEKYFSAELLDEVLNHLKEFRH